MPSWHPSILHCEGSSGLPSINPHDPAASTCGPQVRRPTHTHPRGCGSRCEWDGVRIPPCCCRGSSGFLSSNQYSTLTLTSSQRSGRVRDLVPCRPSSATLFLSFPSLCDGCLSASAFVANLPHLYLCGICVTLPLWPICLISTFVVSVSLCLCGQSRNL